MKAALAYEWVRFSSTRSVWIMLALAIAGSAAFSWAMATMMTTTAQLSSAAGVADAATIAATRSPLAPAVAGVLGVMAFGQETRHRTLLLAILVVPRRRILYAAKALITAAVAAGLCVLCLGAGLGAAYAASTGGELAPAGPDVGVLAGYLGQTLGWALLGLGIGAVLPQLAGILVMLLGSSLVEPLIGRFAAGVSIPGVGDLANMLPFAAGASLVATESSNLSASVLAAEPGGLVPAAGAAVFAAYVAATLLAGLARFRRQDL